MLSIFFSGHIAKAVSTFFIDVIVVRLKNEKVLRKSMPVNFLDKSIGKKYLVLHLVK